MAFAVAEPADPGRESLEGDPFAGQSDPAGQRFVLGELLEHRPVGGGDVGRIARQGHPAERSDAFAEQRADVGGKEARVVERPVEATELRFGPEAVAVVEHLGALVHESDHRLAVHGHRGASPTGVLLGLAAPELGGGLEGDVVGDVAERDRGRWSGRSRCRPRCRRPAAGAARRRRCRADRPTGACGTPSPRPPARPPRRSRGRSRRGSGGRPDAASMCWSTSMMSTTPSFIVTASGWAPPIPPAPAVTVSVPASEPPKRCASDLGETLVGPLEDALGADVDPRPGGHLPVHGEAQVFESTELVPVRPVGHQVGVGDQYPWRPLVGAEHADRFARLDQHRLVPFERGERVQHRVDRPSQDRAARPVPP